MIQFTSMKIRRFLIRFYLRWEQVYEAYKVAGNPEFLDATRMQLFNKSLDGRYKGYLVHIQNEMSIKKDVLVTVEENYRASAVELVLKYLCVGLPQCRCL